MPKGKPLSEEHKAKLKAGREAKKNAVQAEQPNDSFKELESRVDKLVEVVDKIATLITTEKKVEKVVEDSKPVNVTYVTPDVPREIKYTVPVEWRRVMDQYLGVDFKGEVLSSSGGNYSLKIIFPENIDRRIGVERSKDPDHSMASPINRASDVSDVENWCKRILNTIKQRYPDFKPKNI